MGWPVRARQAAAVLAVAALALAAAWASARAALVLSSPRSADCTPQRPPAHIAPPPAGLVGTPFSDAAADGRTAAAAWLKAAGVLRGDPRGRLLPAQSLTLAEAVVLIARAAGLEDAPAPGGAATGPDVPAWARAAFAAAERHGWLGRDAVPAHAARTLTWDEAAALLLQAMDDTAPAGRSPFAAADRLGLFDALRAEGARVEPHGIVTRGDFAVALLAAMLAARDGGPVSGSSGAGAGWLAARNPPVFRAFVALHPDTACR